MPWLNFNSGVRADGLRTRLSPELVYFYGPFGFVSQYFQMNQDMRPSTTKPIVNVPFAGFVFLSTLLLTGETRMNYSEAIAPLRPFDPRCPFQAPGAWELVGRVSQLAVGDSIFVAGANRLADPTKNSDRATEVWGVPGTQSAVKSADLNGHEVQTILPGAVTPGPIAVDPETGNVYFFESPNERHIHRIRPDGSGETPIIRGHVCNGIILDRPAGKLYWISRDKRIWRANFDGSDVEIIADVASGKMVSFAFDPSAKKFYWVDGGSQQLCRSNMDGTQVELLVVRPPHNENPKHKGIGIVAVLPQRNWMYVGGVYFVGIDPYWITYRMEMPPLLKPVAKPAPPKITSFTPDKQTEGKEVVVFGTGFHGTTKVALFDDAAGGEVPVDFDVSSDNKLSFEMPKLNESCRHVAVIVQTPGGVTVTLPTSLSIARPRISNVLPGLKEMNTKRIQGKYGNIWYVIGQHKKIQMGSQQTQTGLKRVNRSLVYVEPQASAGTDDRGHNVMFLKDGAVTGMRQWRSVVYHEPFAIINNDFQESKEQMDAKFIPVSAIRPSFFPELLEYVQPRPE